MSPALSPAARTAQIVPHLSTPLLSTGQINDDGCQSYFDENKVIVTKNTKIVLRGNRNQTDGLYDTLLKASGFDNLHNLIDDNKDYMDINKQMKEDRANMIKKHGLVKYFQNPKINVILRHDKTKRDLIRYLHSALFSPVKSTLIKAINNNQLIT